MLYIIIAFSIIGGLDKLINNKYGLGEKFEEGFKAMGGLALTVIGIYSISPVIARAFVPILNPVSKLMHIDPSVFISSILATDLGAYTTSVEIARTSSIGQFNGLILASMLGSTISFTIPVATNLISKKDFPYFAKGVLSGIVTIPFGMLVSGIIMKIPAQDIISSIIPVIIIAIVISLGLIKAQDKIIDIFNILGRIVLLISTFGLILSILDFTFDIKLVEGMIPFEQGAILVANIAIILSGAYPLLYFISRKAHKYLGKISKKYDIDEYSVLGLISSLVNCIPMMGVYENMNWKGKILNAAFAVSGAFTFGGQLGYVTSVSPEAVNSFILGKLVSGVAALGLAILLIKLEKNPREVLEYGN